jgi:hypothetical protein
MTQRLPYTPRADDIAAAIRELVADQCEVLVLTALTDVTGEFIRRADPEDRDDVYDNAVAWIRAVVDDVPTLDLTK